jgi:uncharacterized protein (TIGR02001 family)
VLRWSLAIVTALIASPSVAQISGSASLVSDYRFRGVSLSHDRPAAQAEVSYDHDSGWYGGLFGSNVQFDDDPRREAQLSGYAGYARRLRDGLSVDAGATYSAFSGGDGYNYSELHVGFTTSLLTGRLYYSPNYFGEDSRTLYAELNGSHRLADKVRLIAHAGVLQSLANAGGRHERAHVDWQAAIEVRLEPFTLQLGGVANDGVSPVYPVGGAHTRGTWTARLSVSF